MVLDIRVRAGVVSSREGNASGTGTNAPLAQITGSRQTKAPGICTEGFRKIIPGLPMETSALVLGPPSSGKSLLCKQFVCEGLCEEQRAIIISTVENSKGIVEEMHSFGVNPEPFFEKNQLRIIDLCSRPAGLGKEAGVFFVDPANLQSILSTIDTILVEDFGRKGGRLVLDCITTLLFHHSAEEVINFLNRLIIKMNANAFTSLFVIEEGVHSQEVLRSIEYLTRNTIRLGAGGRRLRESAGAEAPGTFRKESEKTERGMTLASELESFLAGGNLIVSTSLENYEKGLVEILRYLVKEKGLKGALLSVNKPCEIIVQTLEKHGIDQKNLVIVDGVSSAKEKRAGNRIYLKRPLNLADAYAALNPLIERPENRFFVLDTLTTMLTYDPPEAVRFFQHLLSDLLMARKITILLGVSVDVKDKETKLIAQFCNKIIKY